MAWSQGARDDAGNLQVDFVWGNMPMQPSWRAGDREEGHTFADQGTNISDYWAASESVPGTSGRSFPIDTAINDHVIDYGWWNNYPGPRNYSGWD